jgi:DNA-directed RNA polymerase subunit RPC12/RpoP
MKALHKSAEMLFCPYGKCGKGFTKPLMLTDASKILRETYYACPHCHSKLDIVVEDFHIVRVEKCEGGERVLSTVSCPYNFGYLKALSEKDKIPDECLACPRILQCSIRK